MNSLLREYVEGTAAALEAMRIVLPKAYERQWWSAFASVWFEIGLAAFAVHLWQDEQARHER